MPNCAMLYLTVLSMDTCVFKNLYTCMSSAYGFQLGSLAYDKCLLRRDGTFYMCRSVSVTLPTREKRVLESRSQGRNTSSRCFSFSLYQTMRLWLLKKIPHFFLKIFCKILWSYEENKTVSNLLSACNCIVNFHGFLFIERPWDSSG